MYTVITLVTNQYNGFRLLKLSPDSLKQVLRCSSTDQARSKMSAGREKSQMAFLSFMNRTRLYRHSAVWTFLTSLPVLLVSLAAKQFESLPLTVAIPTSAVLFLSVLFAVYIFRDTTGMQHEEYVAMSIVAEVDEQVSKKSLTQSGGDQK